MAGVMYITQARPVMVIEDASSWVFTGTGLRNGDRLANADGTPFLGYEVDAMAPSSPANVQRLAHSPATPAAANFSDMTVYRAASGATVFATGSIAWSQTVPQIQQSAQRSARFISMARSMTRFPFGLRCLLLSRPVTSATWAVPGSSLAGLTVSSQRRRAGRFRGTMPCARVPADDRKRADHRTAGVAALCGITAGGHDSRIAGADSKYVTARRTPGENTGFSSKAAACQNATGGRPQAWR